MVSAAALSAPASAQELRLNRTIETLEANQPVFGLATGNFSLVNARSLAVSDLDFIIIDMEHSPFDVETLQTFILGMVNVGSAVAKGSPQMDVTPILRIPANGRENTQFLVKQALDVGAYGIMFPFVDTREETLNAISSMRYPQPRGDAQPEPRGARGSSPGNAAWIWGVPNYVQKADVWPLDPQGELLAVIQIETMEGRREHRGDRFGARRRSHLHRSGRPLALLWRAREPSGRGGGHRAGAGGVPGQRRAVRADDRRRDRRGPAGAGLRLRHDLVGRRRGHLRSGRRGAAHRA
jgi:2-keto-3-deoxy-L-rhamnonate aldolase RhmA